MSSLEDLDEAKQGKSAVEKYKTRGKTLNYCYLATGKTKNYKRKPGGKNKTKNAQGKRNDENSNSNAETKSKSQQNENGMTGSMKIKCSEINVTVENNSTTNEVKVDGSNCNITHTKDACNNVVVGNNSVDAEDGIHRPTGDVGSSSRLQCTCETKNTCNCSLKECENNACNNASVEHQASDGTEMQNPTKDVGVFACTLCEMRFESFSDLTDHMVGVHHCKNQRCDICEVDLSSTNYLHKHVDKSHGPACTPTCSICGKSFSSSDQLSKHSANMHSSEHGITKNCDRCNFQSDDVKNSSRCNFQSDVKNCDRCNFQSDVKNSNGCDFQTRSSQRMKTHKKIHLSKTCPICNKILSKSSSLKRHIEQQHKASQSHVCNICGLKFCSSGYLRRHTSLHKDRPQHTCSICGKSFTLRRSLRGHMEIHKSRSERKYRFLCSVCGLGFNGKACLDDHMNKHTGNKPHSCPLCGKTFGFRSMLYKHKQFIHSDLRPFVCKVCSKSFKSKYILLSHMVTHTGVSKFNCPHCKRPFSTCSTLNRHMPRCSVLKPKPHPALLKSSLPGSASDNNGVNMDTIENGDDDSLVYYVRQTTVVAGQYTIEKSGANSKMEPSQLMLMQEEVELDSVVDVDVESDKVYLCSECAAMFSSLDEAEKHIAVSHADMTDL